MSKEAYNPENIKENRDRIIIKTSILGIAANIFLSAIKAIFGLMANSIAIILDAVNNLSDALSSVITIVGTKLASKKPDKKHPLGYGRIEYLSAMTVAAIVLYAGITSLVESIKKIIRPETADYSTVTLIIIVAAVIVKLILGRYVTSVGKKVNSGSLIASGKDASFDAILSASVLLSAIIYLMWNVSLEAYVGVVISVIIIKSGLEMLTETLDEIIGKRVDRGLVKELKRTICEEEEVSGAYDLILHSYGPDRYVGSVHIEIPDTLTAEEIDSLERRIAQNVLKKHGVLLGGIGIYSVNSKDDKIKKMRSDITHLIVQHEGILQIHGFYVDLEKKAISFDVVLDYGVDDRQKLFAQIRNEVESAYPEYTLNMALDIDV
jgi:cation diffusion facilitator family transporter